MEIHSSGDTPFLEWVSFIRDYNLNTFNRLFVNSTKQNQETI